MTQVIHPRLASLAKDLVKMYGDTLSVPYAKLPKSVNKKPQDLVLSDGTHDTLRITLYRNQSTPVSTSNFKVRFSAKIDSEIGYFWVHSMISRSNGKDVKVYFNTC
jgi:hypothetical protein